MDIPRGGARSQDTKDEDTNPENQDDFLLSKTAKNLPDSLPENKRGFYPENSAVKFSNQKLAGEMPAEKTDEFPAEKIDEKITLKPADFFRFELEIRKAKSGHYLTIKKALRFSDSRICRQVARIQCPDLTPKNLEMIRSGNISPRLYEKIISYTTQKGIPTYEQFMRNRPGRGRGLRLEQLDPGTKLQVVRLEQLLKRVSRRESIAPEDGRGETLSDP